jgi:hypothetical protein
MSAVIVGYPVSASSSQTLNAKVLQRQNFQRDINGLETITETYIIRTSDRAILAPEKDTTHASFSSATTKYARMAVETITFDENDGGLTNMSVGYAGLTSSSGLPKPVVRLIPTTGAGIYGPPLTIEVEFVTDVNESQIATGQLTTTSVVQTNYTSRNTFLGIPNILNGLTLPSNPVQPFNKMYGLVGGVNYLGYCQDQVDCTRRGQFLVARVVFREKQDAFGDPAFVSNFKRV